MFRRFAVSLHEVAALVARVVQNDRDVARSGSDAAKSVQQPADVLCC